MLEVAQAGRGDAVLVFGEAGVGKTRLLREARRAADASGLLALHGRAVESGGAYRPLVDAFARPSVAFAAHPDLTAVRPALARVLPGWSGDRDATSPMADPAAVLAEALIVLLGAMAPDGAVLIMDDLHWADDDTLSVLTYLADSVEELHLCLILASRNEPQLPTRLERLIAGRAVRPVALQRLRTDEVTDALVKAELPERDPDVTDRLVAAIDGLPLVLDEFVRQLREHPTSPAELYVGHTTLAAAVHRRLTRLPPRSRGVLDALAVLGESDAALLMAAAGLDAETVTAAIHDGLSSTLLIPAATPLGVTWRHRLMRDAVRDLLLPLEQQALARRAADHLTIGRSGLSDGEFKQAASLYALAGYPDRAAQQLIQAARAAVLAGGLNAAEQYLADAEALTGTVPAAARDVLIERIDVLSLAGRAGDAYDSGIAGLQGALGEDGQLIIATARAAISAERHADAAALLARLHDGGPAGDPSVAVLRAQIAGARRGPEAVALGEKAAALAEERGRHDLACEALLAVGRAARRQDAAASAAEAFGRALSLSTRYELSVWRVRALAELGTLDLDSNSDPTRFLQARKLASAAGMVGLVAFLDLWIGATIAMREGFIVAYPTLARADFQSRQLRLFGIHGQTRAWIAQCLLHADGNPLPGRLGPNRPSEVDDLVAEAVALGQVSRRVSWATGLLALRAWFHGDTIAAIRMWEASLFPADPGQKLMPWWGVWALLRVVTDQDPEDALAALAADDFIGHHSNRAALAYGRAILALRSGDDAETFITEARGYLRETAFIRHFLHTIVGPTMFRAGLTAAEGWLREAEAFCAAAGERALLVRIQAALGSIGLKPSRTAAGTVPPHLARLGVTARELEILRLVNDGFGNPEIAGRLFISIRTVETHVSSLLQKAGVTTREQLPSASAGPQ